MCYPKPGPRCAGHLRAHINRLEQRQHAAAEAFAAGETSTSDADMSALTRDLEKAREEYTETLTGRKEQIAHIETMPDGPAREQALDVLEAATTRYRNKVEAYKSTLDNSGRTGVATDDASTDVLQPLEVVGELETHELSHLGIFTATLSDGRVVAHNTNGPNINCPRCHGDINKQKNCHECAGRGQVANIPFCPRPWDNITEGLFLGGHDNQPGGGDAQVTDQFDMVVSLYQRDGYGPDEGIPHHTHEMIDGALDPVDYPHLHRLADEVGSALDNNQKVLVRCQAGMNRSALVSGLALLKRGWTTDQIVARMREARSEYVLFNQHFVAYLRDQEEELQGTRTRCPECRGHREFFGVSCERCAGLGYVQA